MLFTDNASSGEIIKVEFLFEKSNAHLNFIADSGMRLP
jgi:hypothetical protein